jgi:hypothetical protein
MCRSASIPILCQPESIRNPSELLIVVEVIAS